jgi:hypothetical protein
MSRLNLNQIAKEYRKTPKTFRNYVRELKIPHIRLGREMLFDPAQVEKHLEELTRSWIATPPDIKAKSPKKPQRRTRTASSSRYEKLRER